MPVLEFFYKLALIALAVVVISLSLFLTALFISALRTLVDRVAGTKFDVKKHSVVAVVAIVTGFSLGLSLFALLISGVWVLLINLS